MKRINYYRVGKSGSCGFCNTKCVFFRNPSIG